MRSEDATPSVTPSAMPVVDRWAGCIDWAKVAEDLQQDGWSCVRGLLDRDQALALRASGDAGGMASLFGSDDPGEPSWSGLGAPLPAPLAMLAREIGTGLGPLVERWAALLAGPDAPASSPRPEPGTAPGSVPGPVPTAGPGTGPWAVPMSTPARLCRLQADDYAALVTGEAADGAFPIRLVVLLSEPGAEFTGGEFVMTEQRPRLQSRPMVLPLAAIGDAAFVACGRRPVAGSRGHYPVVMRHGIGRLRSGVRHGLDLQFLRSGS